MSDSNQGWFQCSQCGHGHIVYKWQFEVGDYRDRQGCPHCGIGIMLVDWGDLRRAKNES